MNSNNGPLNNVQILNNTLHGATVTSGDGAGVGGYGYGENTTNVLVQGNTIYNLGMPASSNAAGILANGWSQASGYCRIASRQPLGRRLSVVECVRRLERSQM